MVKPAPACQRRCAGTEAAAPLAPPYAWGMDRVGQRGTDRGRVGRGTSIREARESVWYTAMAAADGADDGLGGSLASARSSEKEKAGRDP
jgi:hypothetical protein